jgi:hypothetical protein
MRRATPQLIGDFSEDLRKWKTCVSGNGLPKYLQHLDREQTPAKYKIPKEAGKGVTSWELGTVPVERLSGHSKWRQLADFNH